jgi:anti-sigma factor RsiW
MNCELARRQIGLNPGPRSHSDATDAAWDHLGSCGECQAFYAAQTRLATRLADLRRTTAPEHLRAEISAALSHSQAPRRGRRWGWLAVAVTATAFAVVGHQQSRTGDVLAAPLARIARSQLELSTSVNATDIRVVEKWIERQIGYRVEVPDIANASLVGARISNVGGQKSALVVYLSRGMPVTYFALPTSTVMGRPVSEQSVLAGRSDGYEVAMWTERGKARAIAAPMTRPEVLEIAQECRSKAATD